MLLHLKLLLVLGCLLVEILPLLTRTMLVSSKHPAWIGSMYDVIACLWHHIGRIWVSWHRTELAIQSIHSRTSISPQAQLWAPHTVPWLAIDGWCRLTLRRLK